MNKDNLRQAIVVVMVIAIVVVNGLATALPLNGQTTGEISDRFQVFFVPAGYVFSIWGLIYLGLSVYAIYQALPAQAENPHLRRIAVPFVIGSLANIAWIFLWHYEQFPLTLVAMLALLVSLIVIYLRLEIGRTKFPSAARWLVQAPFSIYLGWITVATIANVTSLLDYINWGGWGIRPEVWAVIMLIAGLAIASAISLTRGDVAYLLVLIWAFVGIAVKNQGTALVANTAWVVSGLVLILLVVGVVLRSRTLTPSDEMSFQS